MGILDLLHGKNDTLSFLKKERGLSDDLQALLRAIAGWHADSPVDVSESGTLYRFLQFISWKQKLNKQFVLRGTLESRPITKNPEIVNYSLCDLLALDNHTSQWASAAVLCGATEKVQDPPFKLRLTYEAVAHWNECQAKGTSWKPRYDETILRQATTFLELLRSGTTSFTPLQAEDYCFARVFDFIDQEEGEKRWPSLRTHESDRIQAMEEALAAANHNEPIVSKDHRVIQAIGMYGVKNKLHTRILHPESVNKSWPQFWRFLKDTPLFL